MINANRISEILSIGSSRRSDELVRFFNIDVLESLLLPAATQCAIDLYQCKAFFELRLGEEDLGVEVSRVTIQNFQITGDSAAVARVC